MFNNKSGGYVSFNNPTMTSIASNDVSTSQVERPGVNLNVKKDKVKQETRINKLQRYKVGLIFYLIYLSTSISNFFLFRSYHDITNLNPFSETYMHLAFLTLFLFISIILKKCASKKAYNIVNVLKYYVPDWKKEMNRNDFKTLSSTFYIFEGSKEKFDKNVHKISFMLMLLLFFSMCFLSISESVEIKINKNGESLFLISLVFPLAAISIVIMLRKLFLNSQHFDMLSTISIIILMIGIVCLFIFQNNIYINEEHDLSVAIQVYSYACLGGIFFGLFSVFLKYSYNIYGKNFKISLIFGYIGLYNVITIPIVLCLVCIFANSDEGAIPYLIFDLHNMVLPWIGKFAVNVIRIVTITHCVIGLSPLVFCMGMFMDCLINLTLNLCFTKFDMIGWYITSACFILVGVVLGTLDKYLKNKIRDKELEEEENFDLASEKEN